MFVSMHINNARSMPNDGTRALHFDDFRWVRWPKVYYSVPKQKKVTEVGLGPGSTMIALVGNSVPTMGQSRFREDLALHLRGRGDDIWASPHE
jgi:hypothetical protein